MSSLSNFLGKSKEIEIKGEKLIIYPIRVKDMIEFSIQNPTPEQSMALAKKMIQLSIPEVSDEEIENMPLEIFTAITDEINKFNGFTDERANRIAESFRKK